ncbi:MAG: formylglycine-generating enzyme family protein [Leptolyngbya sp. SIO1D8]|nr:formylglycine-generating enzyme family protein [Leptolyngbya sp. SIO1D8]
MKIAYYTAILLLLLVSHHLFSQEKSIVLPGEVPMEFVYIPSGKFLMGSTTEELERHNDEGPVREVVITKGFYLSKYEVTQEQWLAVMDNNPSVMNDTKNWKQHPVDNVSWNDCNAFILKINTLGLGTLRMPTEAEWEYACRAGTTSRYYWGKDSSDYHVHDYAWAFSKAEGVSHPVGLKKPNNWGLYDMSGNVWEWCSDWRGPYDTDQLTDPTGPRDGQKKVYRGGSWFNKPATLRSANRNGHEPDMRGTNAGLRLVLQAED